MNQQRSRRFRTAMDASIKANKEQILKDQWLAEGRKPPKEWGQTTTSFDSNVITPGTAFMFRLSKAIKQYTLTRTQNDKLWDKLVVIYSDHSIPGEGEHKILEFIRLQRGQDNYDPNTHHCLYGADADLIMLGLSTHEAHFYILREVLIQAFDKKCSRCGGMGHVAVDCKGKGGTLQEGGFQLVPFQYITIPVLREYLQLEMKEVRAPFKYSLERIIDDFIFLCFFVGNDFIPNLPSLYIREGAIDSILLLYKKLLPSLGGYLTQNGEINFSRADVLFERLGVVEETFFRDKMVRDQIARERRERNYMQSKRAAVESQVQHRLDEESRSLTGEIRDIENKIAEVKSLPTEEYMRLEENLRNKKIDIEKTSSASRCDRDYLLGEQNYATRFAEGHSFQALWAGTTGTGIQNEGQTTSDITTITNPQSKDLQRTQGNNPQLINQNIKQEQGENKIVLEEGEFKDVLKKQMRDSDDNLVRKYVDNVQLGKEGWKERYYIDKFGINPQDFPEFKKKIQKAYIEGLAWVYAYYYNGCPAWQWFYPFHYAPFASDITNADAIPIQFEKESPSEPLEQLMSVLPPASSHALPKSLRVFMEDDSKIIEFYPKEFKTDLNGHPYAWMAVNLIPFIHRPTLQHAIQGLMEELDGEERERNQFGITLLYTHVSNPILEDVLSKLSELNFSHHFQFNTKNRMIACLCSFFPRQIGIGSEIKGEEIWGLEDIESNQTLEMIFNNPPFKEHLTELLVGARFPNSIVSKRDLEYMDKRSFRGEAAMRMVERCLGVERDSNEHHNKNPYTWDASVYSQSYNTNRGIYSEPRHYKMSGAGDRADDRDQRDFHYNRGHHTGGERFRGEREEHQRAPPFMPGGRHTHRTPQHDRLVEEYAPPRKGFRGGGDSGFIYRGNVNIDRQEHSMRRGIRGRGYVRRYEGRYERRPQRPPHNYPPPINTQYIPQLPQSTPPQQYPYPPTNPHSISQVTAQYPAPFISPTITTIPPNTPYQGQRIAPQGINYMQPRANIPTNQGQNSENINTQPPRYY